jgi:hypothetical protein
MDVKVDTKMINFNSFINEKKEEPFEEEDIDLTEDEINSLPEKIQWKDIEDLYTDDEFVNEEMNEAISAAERLKRGMRMKSRKYIMAMSRRIKLKRTSALPVLQRRAKVAARKMITKRLLQKRKKKELSAQDKNMIETRAKRILKMYKNLPQKLMPKIRQLEKERLASK